MLAECPECKLHPNTRKIIRRVVYIFGDAIVKPVAVFHSCMGPIASETRPLSGRPVRRFRRRLSSRSHDGIGCGIMGICPNPIPSMNSAWTALPSAWRRSTTMQPILNTGSLVRPRSGLPPWNCCAGCIMEITADFKEFFELLIGEKVEYLLIRARNPSKNRARTRPTIFSAISASGARRAGRASGRRAASGGFPRVGYDTAALAECRARAGLRR
jgi:hypothetical protein